MTLEQALLAAILATMWLRIFVGSELYKRLRGSIAYRLSRR